MTSKSQETLRRQSKITGFIESCILVLWVSPGELLTPDAVLQSGAVIAGLEEMGKMEIDSGQLSEMHTLHVCPVNTPWHV